MTPRILSTIVWWAAAGFWTAVFLYPSYALGVSAAGKIPMLILLLLGCYLMHRLTVWFVGKEEPAKSRKPPLEMNDGR